MRFPRDKFPAFEIICKSAKFGLHGFPILCLEWSVHGHIKGWVVFIVLGGDNVGFKNAYIDYIVNVLGIVEIHVKICARAMCPCLLQKVAVKEAVLCYLLWQWLRVL